MGKRPNSVYWEVGSEQGGRQWHHGENSTTLYARMLIQYTKGINAVTTTQFDLPRKSPPNRPRAGRKLGRFEERSSASAEVVKVPCPPPLLDPIDWSQNPP